MTILEHLRRKYEGKTYKDVEIKLILLCRTGGYYVSYNRVLTENLRSGFGAVEYKVDTQIIMEDFKEHLKQYYNVKIWYIL
jgi:hypothetical protein